MLILAVLALVVAINLLVDLIPWKADVTRNGLYSLSEKTYAALDTLQEDVTITILAPAGTDPMLDEILKKYHLRNRRIKVQTVDPDRNPGWSKQYTRAETALPAGTIVVATDKKYNTIDPYALYNLDVDSTKPDSQPQLASHSIEQRVTSALLYIASENVTLYELQGHGEARIEASGLDSAVRNENFEIKELNLSAVSAVPEDAGILFVLSPQYDLPKADADKLRLYLSGGGRAMFLLDLPERPDATPILDNLIAGYGITMRHTLVVEGDNGRYVSGNPLFLLPEQQKNHGILLSLTNQKLPVLILESQAIEPLKLRKQTLKIEPLLYTTERAWSKANYIDLSTLRKDNMDQLGPFLLAAAITDPGPKDTKIVVVGSSSLLPQQFASSFPGNTEFLLNSLNWLTDKKAAVSIQSKNILSTPLQIDSFQGFLLTGFVVILIPFLVLGCGLIVWMRRRHL
jgi:ABC-2 type transport system permease protein